MYPRLLTVMNDVCIFVHVETRYNCSAIHPSIGLASDLLVASIIFGCPKLSAST